MTDTRLRAPGDRGNPKMTIRLDEETRKRFMAAARNAGTEGSAVVKEFIDWYLGEEGAALPERPL